MNNIFKRLISTIMVVLIVLTSAPLSGFVGMEWDWLKLDIKASATDEEYYNYYVNDGKATITQVYMYGFGDITIPSTLGGYPVTAIGDNAFEACSINSIVIPASVTSIVEGAFSCCSGLESITVVEDNKYYSNDNYGVLFNKNKTELIFYPHDNTRIAYSIPDSVTVIGDSAFSGCTNLESITIPNSVTSIGDSAFSDCTNLKSVTIPNTVTTIGRYTFSECVNLTDITIPDSITTICGYAFSDCINLKSLTIPSSVTTIDEAVLAGCSKLTRITVDERNEYYSNDVYGVLYDKEGKELVQYPCGNKRTTYSIPNGVERINYGALDLCEYLTEIIIPESVTFIANTFYCKNLKQISVDENNERYSSDVYGVLFDNYFEELMLYPMGNTRTAYSIPDGVKYIGDGAFADCTNLVSVIIPDSVISVGVYYGVVFSGCTSIESVTIPNSVRKIYDGAFTDCTHLKEVTLGSGITDIPDNTFWGCSSLKSITIPDSVTHIGVSAFTECSSLSNIIIPNSVTSIGEWAFYDCTDLKEVTLGFGITDIPDNTFWGCSKLESITIPNNIERIGECAFYNCSNLQNIEFGNGLTTIGSSAFGYCNELKNVYFYGGEAQWNKIEIGDYNYCLLSATIQFSEEDSELNYENILEKPIKSNEQILRIVDENGYPISGVKISYENEAALYTNSYGVLKIEKKSDSAYIIVEKDGYYTRKYVINHSDEGVDLIILYKELSIDAYKLQSAVYSDNLTKNKDVLFSTKTVNLYSNIISVYDGTFDLTCVPNTTDMVYRYELYQGSKKIAESKGDSNGVTFKDLLIDDFSVGGDVSLRVYSGINRYTSTKINLIFEEDKSVDESAISFGEKIELDINSDIPYFGGRKISVDIPDLPLDVYYGKEKIHVGINVPLYKGEKDEYGRWEKDPEENIKGVKETFELIGDYINAKNDVCPTDEIRELVGSNNKKRFFEDFSLAFVGYGEAVRSGGKVKSVGIDLYVIAESTLFTMTQQYVVWVVPFVINFDISGEVKAACTASLNLSDNTLDGDCKINVVPSLDAFGGVGIGKAVAVGAYGNAELDFEVLLLTSNKTEPKGLKTIDLTGELGVRAYFAGFEFEKDFAYDTWNLYTKNKKLRSMQTHTLQKEYSVYNIDNYSYQDLSYLENDSSYVYDKATTFNLQKNKNNTTDKDVKSLWTSAKEIYRNAQPMVVSSKNRTVVAYLSADTKNRSSINATRAVYSVYDRVNDVWSEPMQIDSDNTADGTPYLYSDGEKIYVTYLNASKEFTAGATIEDSIIDYTVNQNIVVSEFDEITNTFGEIQIVEGVDGDYKLNPQIAVVSDVPTVVWQSNRTDVFGIGESNANKMFISKKTDGIWNNKEILSENLNGIVGIASGNEGIAYIVDGDNNFQTINDRTLYFGNDSNGFSQIETGIVSNPIISSDGTLYWYSNGTLKIYDGTEIKEPILGGITGFNDSFRVSEKNVYYIATCDEGRNIFALIYNDELDEWNMPVQITKQDKDIDYFTITDIGTSNIITLTSRNTTISEENVDDASELGYVVLDDNFDIELTHILFDNKQITPNSDTPFTIGVKNNGTVDISEVTVSVYDDTEQLVFNDIIQCTIVSGEEKEISINVPMSDEINLSGYKVLVSSEIYDEVDVADNEKNVIVGYCDFTVNAEHKILNGTNYAFVSVRNNSYTKSSGVLNIKNSNNDTIKTINVEELDYGESEIYQIIIDEKLLGGSDGAMYFEFNSEINQIESYSRRDEIFVDITESSNILETYDVTWIVDDVETTYTYKVGQEIISPESPTKEGFIFTGWTPEVPNVMPNKDLEFVAQWISIENPESCVLLNHSVDIHQQQSPTCEKPGYMIGAYCNDCNRWILGHEEIPAINHKNATEHNQQDSTCTEIGYTAGKYCPDCESWIEGHDEIPTIEHSYTINITKEPTCTTSGEKTFACVCGESYTEAIEKLGHSEVKISGKAATCTTTGLTDGKKCSVCGVVTVAQQIIAKKAHTYSNACDNSCNNCGATRTASAHKYSNSCDTTCNVCSAKRSIKHTYTNACDKECNVCKATRKITHSYKNSTTKATLSKNGKTVKKCTVCGYVSSTTTIYYPKTIKLSATSYTYNGKVKTPTVTVKDSKGNVLKKDTDYTVKYESGRKLPGKYTVTVTFKGKYSGTKTLSFTITPKTTSKVTATQTTSSITLKWSKVTGATGYRVFQKVNGKWKILANTTKLNYTVKKLKAGTNYTFAVRPYTVDGKDTILASTFTQIKTATKCATPTLKATSTKKGVANLTWTNVAGETGYEVYYSTKKDSGFKKVASYKADVVKGSKNKLTSKKTYYFKVRAYKKTDSGTVYSAWSAVKSIKVK